MKSEISVVIPLYNRGDLILETLVSVEKQILQPQELIVVDDYSTDESASVVKKYAEQSKLSVRLIKNSRAKGVSGAKNCGIEEARGGLIALLDSDDLWTPLHLQRLDYVMRKHPNANMAFSAVKFFGNTVDVSVLEKRFQFSVTRCLKESFLPFEDNFLVSNGKLLSNLLNWGVPFRCPASLLKKDLFIKNGLFFDENIQFTEDAQFITMAAYFGEFLYSEDIGLMIRRHQGNEGDCLYQGILAKSYENRASKLKVFFSDKMLDSTSKKALKSRLVSLLSEAAFKRCENKNLFIKLKEGASLFFRIPCSVSFISMLKLLLNKSI